MYHTSFLFCHIKPQLKHLDETIRVSPISVQPVITSIFDHFYDILTYTSTDYERKKRCKEDRSKTRRKNTTWP